MPKSNTEKHKVLFKGRFSLSREQINSDVAFRVMMKCKSKRKSLVKTVMKIHESGFHIGHVSGLVNIKKLWFFYKDIINYYIFSNERNAMILVNEVQKKYFLSYFLFEKLETMDKICQLIDKTKPTPSITIDPGPSGIYGNIDNTDMGVYSNAEEIIDDNNDIENIDIFFKQINDIDVSDSYNPSLNETIILREPHGASSTFHQSSRIDNHFQSTYEDLFNDESNDFEPSTPTEEDSKLYHLVDDSVYLYSQSRAVPVIDLFGGCESEDEEV